MLKPPLKYPGGKFLVSDILISHLPKNTKSICAPFFGGGGFEIYCAGKGIKIFGYEIFEPLSNFWRQIIANNILVYKEARKYLAYGHDKKNYTELKNRYSEIQDPLEKAAAYFVINRVSFNGGTFTGGISTEGIRRWQKKTPLDLLKYFTTNNITFEEGDCFDTIPANTDKFLYLDPPYMIENSLYGNKGDTHKNFDHEKLRDLLLERKCWILSYNDSPEIRNLYKGCEIIELSWRYHSTLKKSYGKELLIKN